jgi:phytanoyl-CoA hydroxylase
MSIEMNIDAFRTDGFELVGPLFTPEECDRIIADVEQAAFELALGEASDGPLSYRPMMHLASPALQAVATDARWASIVLPLLAREGEPHPGARLYWEQAVAKPPQARTELPWHQDNGYTPLLPEEYVTCWLALDDADVDNGCLWIQPGSHRQGTLQHRNGTGPFRVGYDGDDEGVPVPVPRGHVLVFSSLMLHRSGPNVTDRERRAWIIQFCPGDAVSKLSGKPLTDRLVVADEHGWLPEPVRERELDVMAILANYDQR